jgi:hypothetical protein
MLAQQGVPSRIAPVIRAVLFVASVGAVAWAIAPYLTAGQEAVQPESASRVVVTPLSTTTVVAPPTTVSEPTTDVDPAPTTVPAPATTVAPSVTRVASGDASRFDDVDIWDARSMDLTLDPGWPGTLEATGDLTFVVFSEDAVDSGVLVDQQPSEWTIEVSNVSDERLWALFVYQEVAGQAACDDRILDPGETTVCRVTDVAYYGDQVADVWATAWNIDGVMSADRILQPYTVVDANPVALEQSPANS